jgi:ABC-type Fe3+ transport system substrate-binding protein
MGFRSIRARAFAAVFIFASAGLVHSSAFAADQALIDSAKREGQVTWYTTQIINQLARPAADAFQKKYGISVNFVRGDSGEVALRVLNEHQAGHTLADVIDATSAIPAIKGKGLLMKWLPDGVTRLPKEAFDPDGYWVATNEFIHTPAFNTNLVPRGTEPKTFQDLLDPKWTGKMVWAAHNSTSGAAGFVGTVLNVMGEAKGMSYLRSLAKQKIAGVDGSSRSVVDQVMAGEYPIALQIFNHQPVISAAQGAPVDWIPMTPAMGIFSVTALMQEAPHPNAGKLLEDFLISEQGQQIFRTGDYIPVDPDVPPRRSDLRANGGSFHVFFLSPEQIAVSLPRWFEIYQKIFD